MVFEMIRPEFMIVTSFPPLLALAFLLGGCQAVKQAEEVRIEGIEGSSALLVWEVGPDSGEVEIRVTHAAGSGKEVWNRRVARSGSEWIKDLEPGKYEVRMAKATPQGRKDLGTGQLLVTKGKRSARLLKPEDFSAGKPLGLTTILAIPKAKAPGAPEAYRKACEELTLVSRNLAEIYLGPTYVIDKEDELRNLENVREKLRIAGILPPLVFQSTSLLVVDLRLPRPEGGIRCQLAIRLFDVTYNDYNAENLWNRRPLVFEDFIEVPDFNPAGSNYDSWIQAVSTGLAGLCQDPVVLAYQGVVGRTESRDPAFFDLLLEGLGRRIPWTRGTGPEARKEGAEIYGKLEGMLFPRMHPASSGTTAGAGPPISREAGMAGSAPAQPPATTTPQQSQPAQDGAPGPAKEPEPKKEAPQNPFLRPPERRDAGDGPASRPGREE